MSYTLPGCAGQYIGNQWRTATLCYLCPLHHRASTRYVIPAAKLDQPTGNWVCEEREKARVHLANLRPSVNSEQPPEGGVASVPSVERAQ